MPRTMPCFCNSPECVAEGKDRFEFPIAEGQDVVCPKCGANESPFIGVLSTVHFMIRDKEGPLRGAAGLRYRLACRPEQKTIPTHSNEAASGVLSAVTCIECRAAAVALDVAPHQGLAAPVDSRGYLVPPGSK